MRLVVILSLVLSLGLISGCGLVGGIGQKKEPVKPATPAIKGTTVVLVVPRGQAAAAVNALTEGANIGVASQKGTKNPIRLRVIYSDGNWLQELASQPDRTIIGGVMSETAYQQMKVAGIMDKKVVFVFMPKLPSGDEGSVAWRFFPSIGDQAEACASFCVNKLGIQSVASFSGNDSFSNVMVNEMEQNLASRGVVLQRIQATGSSQNWAELLKPYVNPSTNESNGTLVPNTPFQAVFLTDSWKRLQSVNTAFGANGEDRLVMMGTMLWDGFNARGNQNAAQFALVTWPSPFLRDRVPASLAQSKACTFWGALGYDFARFAARLGLSGRPSAREVTAAARQVSAMSFAMAPISYDSSGMASQKMFMVQAGLGGTVSVDVGTINAAREAASQRVNERGAVEEPTTLGQPAALPASVSGTVPASGPIMRSGPNSSYRLSLPGAR